MYIKELKIGDKVVVVKTREELLNEVTSPEKFLPVGWEGTIVRIGAAHTIDKLFNACDLKGSDGKIVHGYPVLGLMKVHPESERNVVKIVRDIIPFIDDSIEQAELHAAINYVIGMLGKAHTESLLYIIYQYGKTVGVRQERQKKKARLVNRQAMDLANSL